MKKSNALSQCYLWSVDRNSGSTSEGRDDVTIVCRSTMKMHTFYR